jgi:hypothetical protein
VRLILAWEMMRPGWWFLVLAFVLAVAGCGGSDAGSAPTGPAAKAAECPVQRVSSKLTRAICRSPDGAWTLRLKKGTSYGRLFLARRGQSKTVQMYHSNNACCSDIAWARPHLLLFLDYPLVESLDPTTRTVTQLGSLSGMVASPTGQWVAGTGSAGPDDPIATTVYVLGVGAKKCLVVPGTSLDAAGFTRDGKAVIVHRGHPGKPQLRQFALSSLHTDCPRDVVTKRVTSIGN